MGFFDSVFGKKQGNIVDSKSVEQRLKSEKNLSDGRSEGAIRIDSIYNITGIGLIPVGEVIAGSVKPGYVCLVGGKLAEIKTIEKDHQSLDTAVIGDHIGFNLAGVSKSDIKKGDILHFNPKSVI
jgi:translation elongation factor EF-1alpha